MFFTFVLFSISQRSLPSALSFRSFVARMSDSLL